MVRPRPAGATLGNPEARRIADETLGLFADVFAPFAEERFAAAYGPTWRKDRGFGVVGIGAQVHVISDPQELLGRLQATPEFDRVFGPAIGIARGTFFGVAREAKDARNDLYHRTRYWEGADSWRLVDRVSALLGAFDLLRGEARDRLESLAREAASIVAGDRSMEIERLRREYAESILTRTAHLDAGGINARVGSRVVQVRLEDVYVEPRLFPDRDGTDADSLTLVDLLLMRRAVVMGGPGAGKSTLVRRLARTLAVAGEGGTPAATPMIVIANEFAESLRLEPDMSLRRYLTTRLSPRFGSFFAEELELGRATVLIDGLDEVADESLRMRTATLAGNFTHEYPNVGLIATSRRVGYRSPASWASFAELKIAPFDSDQISDFIGRWAAILRDQEFNQPDANLLIEDIARSERVRELAGTPLLLTILVLLWNRGTRLPQHLAELYDLATMTLLRDWPARRLGRSFDERQMLGLLQPVALDLVARGETTVGEADLLTRWGTAFAELEGLTSEVEARTRAKELLRLIGEHTGFFVEVGREAGERRYGFLHKSFAEYLAALELSEQWDSEALDLAPYLHVVRWRHVVELFAAHIGLRSQGAASSVVQAILAADAPFEKYLRPKAALVVHLMDQGLRVRPELRDEVLRRAFEETLDPALTPIRNFHGGALASVARTVPLAVSESCLKPESADNPARRATKAWLRLLVRPESDDCLSDFLQMVPDLFSESDGSMSVASGLRAIGIEKAHEAEGYGRLLRIGGEWFVPGPEAAERLSRVGVPTRRVSEIASDPPDPSDRGSWLVDAESLQQSTVDDIVALLGGSDLFWPIAYAVIDHVEWQAARVSQVLDLLDRVEELPAKLAAYAITASEMLDPDGGKTAWLAVFAGMIVRGGPRARQMALVQYLTHETTDMDIDSDVINAAVAGNPVSARAVPIALALQSDPGPELIEIVQAMALEDPDPIVRGLSRRALAVTVHADDPLTILASPDIAVPASAMLSPGTDTTGNVLSVLLLRSEGDKAQAAAAAVARRIIEVGTFDDFDLGSGNLVSNIAFERLARECADAARPEIRAWAAAILRSLDRGPATDVLRKLLADVDANVRAVAFEAIQETDLRHPAWLEEAALDVFGLASALEAFSFAAWMARDLPPAVLEDLIPLAEAYLDDRPGTPAAVFLLQMVSDSR
jgi:hypothetical protein